MVGARCADVFAGTGAVGIEALSRGAVSCLFVDSSGAAVRAIRANLTRTRLEDRATVVRADAARAPAEADGPFDLLFFDPPYRHPRGDLERVLARGATLVPGGTMVLTRPRRNPIDVIPVDWQTVKVLSYGDARILICREAR